MAKRRDNTLVHEIAGRAISFAIVALAVRGNWWCPLILVPVFWQIWNYIYLNQPKPFHLSIRTSLQMVMVQRRLADFLTWLTCLGYLGYSVTTFVLRFPGLPGWCAGIAVGMTIPYLTKLLHPHRWHREQRSLRKRDEARAETDAAIGRG